MLEKMDLPKTHFKRQIKVFKKQIKTKTQGTKIEKLHQLRITCYFNTLLTLF
jgi:CHAD domain-containing protein